MDKITCAMLGDREAQEECTKECNAQITVQKGSTPKESYINYCMHCGSKIDN